jgi:hypothetical protein
MANISSRLLRRRHDVGRQAITGLDAAVPSAAATGRVATALRNYGGIASDTWAFWRPLLQPDAGGRHQLTIKAR